MTKSYSLIKSSDTYYNEVVREVLETYGELFDELTEFNVKIGIIAVNNIDRIGVVLPAFDTLPYEVKICSSKNRALNKLDAIIYIDHNYYDNASEKEKHAIIFGAYNQIEIIKDKDGIPSSRDDGAVKLRVKKPDIIFTGFIQCLEKFGFDSPEMKAFQKLKLDHGDVLY